MKRNEIEPSAVMLGRVLIWASAIGFGLLLLSLPLWATEPQPLIDQDQQQGQDQYQSQGQSSEQNQSQDASVTIVDDEPRVQVRLGGAGMVSYSNFTADCVAPKAGGFFKRGFNFLGVLGTDRAVELNAACLAAKHEHEMQVLANAHEARMAEIALQTEIVRLERLQLETCCGQK